MLESHGSPNLTSVNKYCRAVTRAVKKTQSAPLLLKDPTETIALICDHLNRRASSTDPRVLPLLYDTLSICLVLSGRPKLLDRNCDEGNVDLIECIHRVGL